MSWGSFENAGPLNYTQGAVGAVDPSSAEAAISAAEQDVQAAVQQQEQQQQSNAGGVWDKIGQGLNQLTTTFGPGTPGGQMVSQGAAQLAAWIQQSKNSLKNLKAQLARKMAAYQRTRKPAKKARLQTEIQLLQQQIAQLENALRQRGVPQAELNQLSIPWWGWGLGGLAIFAVLGSLVYFMRRR